MINLFELLQSNEYPGRGIFVGRSPDGAAMMTAYFIMGRSENSRNRVFTPTEDGIKTEAFDPSKVSDPSLIIYHPVRVVRQCTIVTNGDQTDTIRDALESGSTYIDALRTRTFEPDGPIFTPRISAVLPGRDRYAFSILKAGDGAGSFAVRNFYEYDAATPGTGHLIHTYQHNAPTPPAFSGEPTAVSFDESSPAALGDKLWAALNQDNRISLFVRKIDLETGRHLDHIINQHG